MRLFYAANETNSNNTYRAHDAEMFTHVVKGDLTAAERAEWRTRFDCDREEDEPNNMFFRTLKPLQPGEMADLFCVDGEEGG